ncbi:MAG TPA: TonB family protein [Dokdonella sp.]|uniref:energy transducer TonB n=1 Tax=Dokdonella sp. TaxID=2291710 RepID=UPI002C6C982B|nr:TonB family protein [Dokdonella sp.]HPG94361.1 TonB family protein [Dokdonella sp.]HPN79067.1 TonB family protein [Dokdonella sp.]
MSSGSADRFGVTFLFSLIAHAVVALGITFSIEKPAPSLPALDVILVQSASGKAPEKADFLAQANNTGGGDSEKARRPTDPLSSPIPKPIAGITPRPTENGAPRPTAPSRTELLTTRSAERSVDSSPETPDTPDLHAPSEREIIERKLEMARLAQEIQRETEQYAKRPKRKYISANTKEYAYASYMSAWVARIERIGNLNYPDEARRQEVHGQLVLTVGLNRDGSIKSIDIIQPSGHKILDDAAIRIVNLATPFNPLPKNVDAIDELYITRTWQFLEGNILRNR